MNRTTANILFAIADDWSYGHAGIYGCKWIKTPAMDRPSLNRTQGQSNKRHSLKN